MGPGVHQNNLGGDGKKYNYPYDQAGSFRTFRSLEPGPPGRAELSARATTTHSLPRVGLRVEAQGVSNGIPALVRPDDKLEPLAGPLRNNVWRSW